jgi:hypothetical protein
VSTFLDYYKSSSEFLKSDDGFDIIILKS